MTAAERYEPIRALDDAQLMVELISVEDEIEEIRERLDKLNSHLSDVVTVVTERLGVGREANRRWCVEHGLTTLEDEADAG